jgi:3-ketosteroid 9alpha-monooxygenase subunit A
MAGLARAIIKDVNKQLDQDKVVWDRQQYQPNAIICQGDGPIPQFRRYYARFYAGEDGTPAARAAG